MHVRPDIFDRAHCLCGKVLSVVQRLRPGLYEHSLQVARSVMEMGHLAGLSDTALTEACSAALLHDVGKLCIQPQLLGKAGQLTPAEYLEIQGHCSFGRTILQGMPRFAHLGPIVHSHHEHYDGGGYPEGLAGETIPLAARLIHIADSIDVMYRRREYKDVYPTGRVRSELHRCRGGQFDPGLTDAALAWLELGRTDRQAA